MNPYKVLEINENANQKEIRAAYLKLVKKYHPDKYPDNDLKEMANEKLKQVNEAYDMLTKGGGQSTVNDRSNTYGGSYAGPNSELLHRAREYIVAGNFGEARRILDSIELKNAEWNYLYGILYMRQGWYDQAASHLRMAYEMEPNNAEYRNAYMSMAGRGNPFAGRRYYGNNGVGVDPCNVCTCLLCSDCCCESMGGNCC